MKSIAVVILLAGCGDNLPETPDAAHPDSGLFHTAPHTALPQAIPHANQVLEHPKLVTITYMDYPLIAMTEAWADAVVTSSWWPTVGAEYGIGTMTHDSSYTIPTHSPTTVQQDVDLEAQIQTLITNGLVPTPPNTDNQYIYMIYLPKTVPLGETLLDLFGYHAQLTYNGAKFSYAVIVDDGSGIATTTTTSSHELIEAATDPYDPPNDGWYTDPPLPDPWALILGEVADLCSFEPTVQESDFTYQRIWSNAAAAASMNPCIPNTGDAWETVSADPPAMPTALKGSTVVFTLTGWSTEKIDNWNLTESDGDYSVLTASQMSPTFSTTIINNAKTATVTLHVPSNATSGSSNGIYILSGEYDRPWAVGFRVQ